MDRGTWCATVHGSHKRVEYDWATKQQKEEEIYFQEIFSFINRLYDEPRTHFLVPGTLCLQATAGKSLPNLPGYLVSFWLLPTLLSSLLPHLCSPALFQMSS